ncbi:MAG TPA: hypothetical protein VKA34_07515 [Balneolales bacterium]|nr:hypothetical protein [Balneolales bacterium]
MKKRNFISTGVLFLMFIIAWGCSKKTQNESSEDPETIAPVKVTHVQYKTLADTLTVNGQVMEGEHFIIRAPLTGYITKVWIHSGEHVKAGQRLFTLRTREQEALGSANQKSSLPKPMDVVVKAPVSGQITSLNIGSGIYATGGSKMAMMTSNQSVYLKLFIPMKWSNEVQMGDSALVQWADGKMRWAKLGTRMVQADSQSQSAMYIVNDLPTDQLLAGERLTVLIPINKIKKGQVLPQKAVLTDESMSSYWVMKLINDSTAIRVNVKPGLSTNQWVAVTKPKFQKTDRILVEGNYGLPDTARVKVIK